MSHHAIHLIGARQNNLKNLDLELPLNEFIVITGVSGSGKSSLAFDTLYAEGQRRYVETFSPYARQFLDRMDKPQFDRIEGIPPAIAIDQNNPVRTSRSTVGTMTELNDHLKLLYARASHLHCRACGAEVHRDTPESACHQLLDLAGAEAPRAVITFTLRVPDNFSSDEVRELLARQGYTRVHHEQPGLVEVVQDRLRLDPAQRDRLTEALEQAMQRGHGKVAVYPLDAERNPLAPWRFSSELHCAYCDIDYHDPSPSLFSFNSPMGACDSCRGFGRVIGVDYGLVVPDESLSLADGAIKPWQTDSYRECQDDLMRFARQQGIPRDVPWRELSDAQREWVLEGEGHWDDGVWYGVRRFFDWLETKSYKMHIRVLLSKYRAYTPCPVCQGARLKPDALLWRVGSQTEADTALAGRSRFRASGQTLSDEQLAALPGLSLHDLMLLPISQVRHFFAELQLPAPLDQAADLLLSELRHRLDYLIEVGLGYLTLDRQSRTLSGGEVQRINLTTALGTSLVNTLFVLDEPSIGLHPRDINRITGVLHRLRDTGNTLLVVEHDPQLMLAADRLIDIGPGPGERGGNIVFNGRPEQLLQADHSLTAQYLLGQRHVTHQPPNTTPPQRWLDILGAEEHNLKDIDLRLPLNRLVCLTGVSGSGKSTLVHDICYHGLRKLKGLPTEAPGQHRAILGHEQIDAVVMVDQSPIGKTTRSNPASYVGAFDAIRKLFAVEPQALERGYTAATFSFNSGNGRCPSCSGTGFEHVEMQFLSDVYLRCPDCDGTRYRPETREVTLVPKTGGQPRNIAQVLDMTVAEAVDYFRAYPTVRRLLEPLQAVGLDYLRLGQPVPTLSGGEAQRLKLAGHLAEAPARRKGQGTLFLFDEPTTGLHFDDIAKLLQAFRRLLDGGDSLLVIEHNLDVIASADWIIDLGPEGGDGGGMIVFEGTVATVSAHADSHTGAALRDYDHQLAALRDSASRVADTAPAAARASQVQPSSSDNAIVIRNAREHNLHNVDITIPRDRFTVITGVSGSGKSTVAFDILFNEGQRRYLESLNAYARSMVQPASRPEVDLVTGIPPTVAIEQRTSRGGRKSTVATMTELYHFLRLLFVKLGTQYCPDCNVPIDSQTPEAILAHLQRSHRGQTISLLAPLVVARKGYYTDLAKWAAARGFKQLRVDGEFTDTAAWPRLDRFREHTIELPVGDISVSPETEPALRQLLQQALDHGNGLVSLLPGGQIFSTQRACPCCARSFAEPDPRLFSYNSRHGWCEQCFGTGVIMPGFDGEQSGEEIWWNDWFEGEAHTCPACQGARLRPEALAVRFSGHNIAALTALPVGQAREFFEALQLDARGEQIARDILRELRSRLGFLQQVGLGYLALDRAAPTLSGGEAQRIRLAAQLGSNLQGVCYILDEPTIGLHPRDNRMLLDTLHSLEAKGNTVVVVEHDEETIRSAEYLIDLGPGAGSRGGRVVAHGSVADVMASTDSVTGQFLAQPLQHPLMPRRPVDADTPRLQLQRARQNNLHGIDAAFPLQRLIGISGVSGSGKSTLIRGILQPNIKRLIASRDDTAEVSHCQAITGWQAIDQILEVDQTPIGKTPRSCPATYIGFWDEIRKLFTENPEARLRGYGPSRFSFNMKGGRCESCEGQGMRKIEMSFLPNVSVPCEACHGARFNQETLAIHFRGQHIGNVLNMSVDDAVEFFSAHPKIHRPLQLLQDVGLGYLTLGQPSPTLSGGEAQRIKLVSELSRTRSKRAAGGHTLYLLDEPTIGLHMADVEKLIRVLHRLVEAGHTVIVIEHNLDVLAEADWLIDMGPEGGDGGGHIVAEGPPELLAQAEVSHTARFLKELLGASM